MSTELENLLILPRSGHLLLKFVPFDLSFDSRDKCVNFCVQVAYWLLQHKVSVMMAACDTFRSGAVEQLRTHARRLQVYDDYLINHEIVYQNSSPIFILDHFQIPIFEKGYEKDPAIVAKEAIQEASRNGSEVVLVDTAGRMQVCNLFLFIQN